MKRYDRAYFDRWYRDPRSRVKTRTDVERKARMALAVTEFLLERPVRTVLDVGAGEGTWYAALRRVRPRLRYVGVDPSEYAVRRYGRRRHLRLGTLESLDSLGLRGPFDLVVCSDFLNYLPGDALERGLRHVRALMGGVAYLELYTSHDEVTGDTGEWHQRPPAFYRRLARRLGLLPCGLHCYVGPALAPMVAALERGWGAPTPA